MRWIRNLELKNKLVLLAAVSGTMALLMSCSVFVWHDLRLLKSSQIEHLRNQAEILAFKCSSVIDLGQPNAAEVMLAKLKSPTAADCVYLFDSQGRVITSYPLAKTWGQTPHLPENHYSHRYSRSGELELFYPVSRAGHEIGVVCLRANMRDFYEEAIGHAIMIITVTLCSLAVAVLFAHMMQSLITRPILRLADAARQISTNNDYAIRVHTDAHDEMRVLYDAFNHMIGKIQTSQSELQQARDELEDRVFERTKQLQEEIVQRERIQQELVRAKEAAEQASEAKSRFLANMSHEIRTPLNGILGFTDFVLIHDRDLVEVDRREYLKTIKKSGESLLVLINNILDLSKIEAGQMEFEKVRFSPHGVIAEVISILRPKALEKNLTLDYRWQGLVPDSIQTDPLRFRQLLVNLIGNAVKFSETGGVMVVARVDQASNKLAVEVSDTGIGIAPEVLPALFKPFTQGDSSVTRRFGGTGLGLSICQSIVKGLGGEIRVTSQLGQGSTFAFTIDTGSLLDIEFQAQPPHEIELEQSGQSERRSLQSVRILVAEDGESNRRLIQLILSRAGADVVLVENGKEAVEESRRSEFDLILLDMQMPVMDGYTAANQMRAEGVSKPIVALTAHAMRGDEERCINAGCSEYLTKPIRHDLLVSKIAEMVSGRTDVEVTERPNPSDEDSGVLISELPIEEPAFAELVRDFVSRAREKVVEIRCAHEGQDHRQLAKLAHWMKGAGGMAGFSALTTTALSLEASIESADEGAIDAGLASLESLVDRLHSPG